MIIDYKYGFDFDGILYGWKDKKLYRLPQMINKRFYPIKELTLINVGNQKGYNINRKKKSIRQLQDMTIFINYKHQVIKDKDCPF